MPAKKAANGHKTVDLRDLTAADLVPVYRFKKGQRVLWDGQCGIVESVRRGKVTVYWGTRTASEGKPGVRIVTTVPATELEPCEEKVVSADEIAERQAAEVKQRYQK